VTLEAGQASIQRTQTIDAGGDVAPPLGQLSG
jgi:hypothetical protein